MSWRERAACHTYDSELFFPDQLTARSGGVERAKAVCRVCPVREACLRAALDGGEKVGIWGGKTPAERELVKRRKRHAARRDRARAEAERPEFVTHKRCSGCKEPKPRSEFYQHQGRGDGLGPYCKPCHAAKRRENRAQARQARQAAS